MKPKLDFPVDEHLARRLIGTQFPHLRDANVRHIGSGWDNAAYLVEEHLVFRFPQRAICAPLMRKELATLPKLAPQLPVHIPRPAYAGEPNDDYPYPFGGYEILLGVEVEKRALDDGQYARLAHDLGDFLRALHGVDPQPLREAGLPNDEIGKLDPKRLGVEEPPLEGRLCIVHGDLYEKHLLLDQHNHLCAVIDWGDLHYGSPAVDLSAVHMVLPPRVHDVFLAAYGPVDERSWQFARYRARYHQAMRANA
ncbi:MAG TPA: phosphotransferase [Candidatus Acidoferrales bacterium]|nr:phosphotransferase [Candidatus Acidoferrales bacterium]